MILCCQKQTLVFHLLRLDQTKRTSGTENTEYEHTVHFFRMSSMYLHGVRLRSQNSHRLVDMYATKGLILIYFDMDMQIMPVKLLMLFYTIQMA